jgi:Mg-chelatase subunit ChlD
MSRRSLHVGFWCCVLGLALSSCSSKKPEDGSSDGGVKPLFLSSADGGFDFSSLSGADCVSSTREAEALPLDLYVLFDQSGSMVTPAGDGTRLDAVRAALVDFLRDPKTDGIGVGLGYFGNFPIGHTSCVPADYATPAVPIEAVPTAIDPLVTSLNAVVPIGETPTGPAITGACSYVEAWQAAHPGRTLALLLLTDGVPEAPVSKKNGCDPTLADAIAATKACVAATGSQIYVLGVGPNLSNLDQIAAAGGTTRAQLVDGADVSGDVLAALDVIRGTALPCSFEIPAAPSGETLDYARVNVILTDNQGADHGIYSVANESACDANHGGWFYTPSASQPENIELCPASCEFTKSQSRVGAIRFALGCQSVTEIK